MVISAFTMNGRYATKYIDRLNANGYDTRHPFLPKVASSYTAHDVLESTTYI